MSDHPGSEQTAHPIRGVHHGAFRCRDAEQTIWFYRDVLGLELAGGVALDSVPGTGRDDPYMHVFFRMGNGAFIAFFDAPGSANPSSFDMKDGFDLHWAFEVDGEDDLRAIQARLKRFGIKCYGPIDHEFVRSIYLYDPNGIQIEFTARDPRHDQILAASADQFPDMLRAWSARTREAKIAKFGQAALDQRPILSR